MYGKRRDKGGTVLKAGRGRGSLASFAVGKQAGRQHFDKCNFRPRTKAIDNEFQIPFLPLSFTHTQPTPSRWRFYLSGDIKCPPAQTFALLYLFVLPAPLPSCCCPSFSALLTALATLSLFLSLPSFLPSLSLRSPSSTSLLCL